jgi:hypothetical protein
MPVFGSNREQLVSTSVKRCLTGAIFLCIVAERIRLGRQEHVVGHVVILSQNK